MTLTTTRACLEAGRTYDEPYSVALATVRLAIDTAYEDPDEADDALRQAQAIAADYGSQYIREFAVFAHGMRETVFGDLPVALECSERLSGARSRAMRNNRSRLVSVAGATRLQRSRA